MRENPSYPKYSPPLACELKALFDAIPDESLLASLKTYYAGRRGYTQKGSRRAYARSFMTAVEGGAMHR